MSRWQPKRHKAKTASPASQPALPPAGATISSEEYRRLSGGPISPRTPRGRPEEALQIEMVTWLDALEDKNFVFTHPANERKDKIESIRAAKMGQLGGVADLIFWIAGKRTLAVEVKALAGSLSENQRRFRDDLRKLGHPWEEARSMADLFDAMIAHGCEFKEPYPAKVLRLGPDAFNKS